MRRKLVSLRGDFWIDDDRGKRLYRVRRRDAPFRDTWVLEDLRGKRIAMVREKVVAFRDATKIFVGGRAATVRRDRVGRRYNFTIYIDAAANMHAHRSRFRYKYDVQQAGHAVGSISRNHFGLRTSYRVETVSDANRALVLALAVAMHRFNR